MTSSSDLSGQPQGMGASATPSGSHPSDQARSGLGAPHFDPSRAGWFRKRPAAVRAFQWLNQDRNDWPEWAAEDTRLEEMCAVLVGVAAVGLRIWTLEGPMRVSPKDWIIKGIHGELYPCKPDIFAASHDAIAIEAATAGETCNRLDPKGESAGRQASPSSAHPHPQVTK